MSAASVATKTTPPLPVGTTIGPGLTHDIPFTSITLTGDDTVIPIPAIPPSAKDSSDLVILPTEKSGEYARIACVHDGHSFLHALLKAISAAYNRVGAAQRTTMARTMRSEYCAYLAKPNKGNWPDEKAVLTELYDGKDPRISTAEKALPLNAYFFTLGNGSLQRLTAQAPSEVKGYDYLKAQLDSNVELPSILYAPYLEMIYLNVNVYTLPSGKDAVPELVTVHAAPPHRSGVMSYAKHGFRFSWSRPTIMLLECTGSTYELIAYRPSPTSALITTFNSRRVDY